MRVQNAGLVTNEEEMPLVEPQLLDVFKVRSSMETLCS
jgi:hypothetical protein